MPSEVWITLRNQETEDVRLWYEILDSILPKTRGARDTLIGSIPRKRRGRESHGVGRTTVDLCRRYRALWYEILDSNLAHSTEDARHIRYLDRVDTMQRTVRGTALVALPRTYLTAKFELVEAADVLCVPFLPILTRLALKTCARASVVVSPPCVHPRRSSEVHPSGGFEILGMMVTN